MITIILFLMMKIKLFFLFIIACLIFVLFNTNLQVNVKNTNIDYNNLLEDRNEYYQIIYEKKLLNIDELNSKMILLNNNVFNDTIRRNINIIYHEIYIKNIKYNINTKPIPLLYLDINKNELILNYKVFLNEMIRYYNQLTDRENKIIEKYESIDKLLLQLTS